MNKLILAALAASLSTSVSAKQQLTVTANPSLTDWAQIATRTLDAAFERVDVSRSETGITYVRFNIDRNGRPHNITTLGTGEFKPNLQRAGRKAVGKIHTFGPLFDGAKANLSIEAAIIVADDQDQLHSLLAKVHERARQRDAQWAADGVPSPIVSLNVVSAFEPIK